MNEEPFPKKDGDHFIGNMGDQMIFWGGKFWLERDFDEIAKREAKRKEIS